MKPVNSLEHYVEIDNLLIDKNEKSDFVDFCNAQNDDIIEVCECIREISSFINNVEENDFDTEKEYNITKYYLNQISEIIKKVID